MNYHYLGDRTEKTFQECCDMLKINADMILDVPVCHEIDGYDCSFGL